VIESIIKKQRKKKEEERRSTFFPLLPIKADTAIGHVLFMIAVDGQQ
jgi:hypothetical protein